MATIGRSRLRARSHADGRIRKLSRGLEYPSTLSRKCDSPLALLVAQARYDQTYLFESDLRRESVFQVSEAGQTDARAGRLDDSLPVAVDPRGLELEFSSFNQGRYRGYDRRQLSTTNIGNILESFSFRQQT